LRSWIYYKPSRARRCWARRSEPLTARTVPIEWGNRERRAKGWGAIMAPSLGATDTLRPKLRPITAFPRGYRGVRIPQFGLRRAAVQPLLTTAPALSAFQNHFEERLSDNQKRS